MNKNKSFAIKVCGPAGTGIMLLGEMLGAALNKAGFYCLVYPEYPSRIRGGDNNVQIIISQSENIAAHEKVAGIFLLDKSLRESHVLDLLKDGKIFDSSSLGFDKLTCVKENPIVKNTVMLGFIWKLLGQELSLLTQTISEKVDEKFIAVNLDAVKEGFNKNNEKLEFAITPQDEGVEGATGNEMISRAAIAADLEYASIYPMTPTASLLNYLSKSDVKMIVPEDEIFAALSALGASIAGKRAMTATSGGGFCLMTEAVGFSAMAEIPLVIILGQRTGPSSGIPTYTSQSDLNFAISPSHGEFSHIVFAPGNLKELFYLTQEAFNMADIYQTPVIILTDKYLSESRLSYKISEIESCQIKIDRGKQYSGSTLAYLRYQLTDDGLSPRAIAGQTTFVTNSYEHDESGLATDDGDIRQEQMAKRLKKLQSLSGGFEVVNETNAKDIIVTWGSTRDATREFIDTNPSFAHLHIYRVWPFPEEIKSTLAEFDRVFVIEGNSTGQMAEMLSGKTDSKLIKILKDDGRPFYKEDLEREILNHG